MAKEILPGKKVCLLCDNPLSGEGAIRRKSKEHVFPSWVLEKFNLKNKPIRFSRLEAMQDERSLHISQQSEFRAFDLDSFLLGSVCKHCNNGWMSRLEDLTKPALSDLIAEQHATAAPDLALAKWVLKTAYVLSAYLDPPIGRIPRSHGLSLVGDQLQLPKGVAVFHQQTSEFRVWFSICPTFIVEDSDKDAMMRRYKASYKYVLQLGHAQFMAQFYPDSMVKIVYNPESSTLLGANSAVAIDQHFDYNGTEITDETFLFSMSNLVRLDPNKRLGRNDFCPCGSTRKYKNCHPGAYDELGHQIQDVVLMQDSTSNWH